MLFEELYKFTGLAVYFSNLPELHSKTFSSNIKRKITQIIINTPNYFFLNVFTLF